MRRRTLVDRLERRITEAEPFEFDWLLEVRLACERQNMEWELEIWRDAVTRRETGPVPAGSRPR
jgi:hypothetical protein